MAHKGQPKTPGSGRKKGKNFAADIRNALKEREIDVIELFFDELASVDESAKKCDLILKFMEFCYPKARMEIHLSVDEMEPEEFKEFMKQGVARIHRERTSDPS